MPRENVDVARFIALNEQGKTLQEIAAECGVSRTTVRDWLVRSGVARNVKKRPRVRVSLARVRELYCECGMGSVRLAKELGVCTATAQHFLRLAGVTPRSRSAAQIARAEAKRPRLIAARVRQLYTDEVRSLVETAALLGVKRDALVRFMRANGIARRRSNYSEYAESRYGRIELDEVELRDCYVVKRMTQAAMARRFGTSRWTIGKELRRLDLVEERRRNDSEVNCSKAA